MTPRELLEEHRQFLAVYKARISRAKQVLREYDRMREPLLQKQLEAERRVIDLEREHGNADAVIAAYTAKVEETTRIIAELERGGKTGIMGSGEGTRPRKKPGRLNQLLRLRRKLNKLLLENPDLAEYLEEEEE